MKQIIAKNETTTESSLNLTANPTNNATNGTPIQKTGEPFIYANIVRKSKNNIKGEQRISDWFINHKFCTEKYRNSDLMLFIRKCPLTPEKKHLGIHNTNITDKSLSLMLKDANKSICLYLEKVSEGFIMRTSKEPAWMYNSKGKFIKRIEHKKVKIWLNKFGIHTSDSEKTDLEEFISSCPICNVSRDLRFHRAADNRLDLQCGCINYFRLYFVEERFIFTNKGIVLKQFDKDGKSV